MRDVVKLTNEDGRPVWVHCDRVLFWKNSTQNGRTYAELTFNNGSSLKVREVGEGLSEKFCADRTH
jgi:hypothetical protein